MGHTKSTTIYNTNGTLTTSYDKTSTPIMQITFDDNNNWTWGNEGYGIHPYNDGVEFEWGGNNPDKYLDAQINYIKKHNLAKIEIL